MFAEEDLIEGEKAPVLGPHYFDSRRVAQNFMEKFEAEQFKPMIDKFASDLQDRLWGDMQNHLMSDTESNLQGDMWRMIDNCVKALLTGEGWALKRYALSERYNDGEKIRQAVAAYVPKEIQDMRIADLEDQVKRLKDDLHFYKDR